MERHWGRVPKSKPRANSRCQIRITSTPLMDRSRGTANSCSTRFLSTSRRSIRASMALLGTSLVDGRLRPYCRSGVACHWRFLLRTLMTTRFTVADKPLARERVSTSPRYKMPFVSARITSAVPVTTIRSVAAQSSDRAGTVRLCSKIPGLLTPVSETLSLVLTPRTEEARESYEACPSGTWTLASRKTYMLQNVWARSSRPFSRTCSTITSCPTPTSSLVIKETGVLLAGSAGFNSLDRRKRTRHGRWSLVCGSASNRTTGVGITRRDRKVPSLFFWLAFPQLHGIRLPNCTSIDESRKVTVTTNFRQSQVDAPISSVNL